MSCQYLEDRRKANWGGCYLSRKSLLNYEAFKYTCGQDGLMRDEFIQLMWSVLFNPWYAFHLFCTEWYLRMVCLNLHF